MLSLSDFRLARSSLIRWRVAADAAPDQARACGHGAADFYLVGGAAAELSGRLRRRLACNTAVRGLRRAFSLGFQAGAIESLSVGAWLPTPRRIRPERAATAPPISIWLAARRPSYRVGFADGWLATPR